AVDGGGFLINAGEAAEEGDQEGGGVGHLHTDVDEDQHDLGAGEVGAGGHGEQRHDDHDMGQAHGGDEAAAHDLVAAEDEAAEQVGGGGADEQRADHGAGGVEQRVQEEYRDVVGRPGFDVVFGMQAGGELEHFAAHDLRRGGKAGRHDPQQHAQGEQAPQAHDQVAGQQPQLFFHTQAIVGRHGAGIFRVFHGCASFTVLRRRL